MFDQENTNTVTLNHPISSGFAKEIEGYTDSTPYTSDDRCSSDVIEIEEFERNRRHIFPKGKQPTLKDWMIYKGAQFSKNILITFASTQVDLIHLTKDDCTFPFDQSSIVNIIPRKQSINVTISNDLIMSREQTRSSSFLGPSGAYLTWIEMFGENSHGDK